VCTTRLPAPAPPTTRRPAISAGSPASRAYAEEFVPEHEVAQRARARGTELGCTPVGPGGAAALRVLAAAVAARAVVEVGTGAGVSGLALLEGMGEEGVLTSIDVEAEHQRAAKEAFAEAGVRPQRTRLITGRALDVLPRLTDGAYDLVLLDADKTELEAYLAQALRLLRPGGVLAVDNALWSGKVADPAQRDEKTTAIRELGKAVRREESLVSAMLPVGDGLLVSVRR
jgi:predicted O-methyltransferase YrrM